MIQIIREVSKKELKDFLYHGLDIEDKNLYKEMSNPNSIGIFQMNGGSASKLIEDIVPENFDELNACNALSRPGTIENAPLYLEGKNGAPSKYPETLDFILGKTQNICIYQEQAMEIFHKIGGFTLEQADTCRSLMKKLSKTEKDPEDLKKWDKAVKKFTRGAVKIDITEKEAKTIADDLVLFSSYSFNKAHATAYTYTAVMTLYLSYYFRKYFYSSVLKYEVDRDKYLFDRLQSVKQQGFEILPPDINKSDLHFIPLNKNKILFGLSNIKFVGENPAKIIIENRPYKSVIDFIVKTRCRIVTSRVISTLIAVGAFDAFETNRKKLLYVFENFWKTKKSTKIEEKLLLLWQNTEKTAEMIPGLTTTKSDLRKFEQEFFGFNFFTTLFTKEKLDIFDKMEKQKLICKKFSEATTMSRKIPVVVNSIRSFVDKNGNEMCFISCEDIVGKQESIPVFASYFQFLKQKLISNKLYLMNLFRGKENKILFGQSQWTTNEFKIQRMLKEI